MDYIVDRYNQKKGPVPIFKNPTSKELREATKDNAWKMARVLLNEKSGDVWVWDGDGPLHFQIQKKYPETMGYGHYSGQMEAGKMNIIDGSGTASFPRKVCRNIVRKTPGIRCYVWTGDGSVEEYKR